MSTVILLASGGHRLLTKGAAERVLYQCTQAMNGNGKIVSLSEEEKEEIALTVVQPMAASALRTIALAYRYTQMCVSAHTHRVVCIWGVLGHIHIQHGVYVYVSHHATMLYVYVSHHATMLYVYVSHAVYSMVGHIPTMLYVYVSHHTVCVCVPCCMCMCPVLYVYVSHAVCVCVHPLSLHLL